MPTTSVHNRYKQAMLPALVMGILTNAYILGVLYFVEAFDFLLSPTIGGVIFIVGFYLLKVDKINAKQSFLFASYTVALEILVHTHALGWDSGFFYFMLLLPIVFLLNSTWEKWMMIFFNGSIFLISVVIMYFYYGTQGAHPISEETASIINLLNGSGTGVVVIVVMIYFSKTINRKDDALVEANIELERQNKEIKAQHQHQQILLKEIHHRVKNNLQIISSLIALQKRTVDDDEIITVLNESRRRVEAIALIHQKLYQGDNINQVDFKSYVRELLNIQQDVNSHIKCNLDSDEVILDLDIAVPLGLIISEMITNSIKHAFKGVDSPELNVLLSNVGDKFELVIKDNGIGLPEDFDINNPASLGSEIILALTEQIDAQIEYFNDNGANFKISFKIHTIKGELNVD